MQHNIHSIMAPCQQTVSVDKFGMTSLIGRKQVTSCQACHSCTHVNEWRGIQMAPSQRRTFPKCLTRVQFGSLPGHFERKYSTNNFVKWFVFNERWCFCQHCVWVMQQIKLWTLKLKHYCSQFFLYNMLLWN